jgi:hypothetical protein
MDRLFWLALLSVLRALANADDALWAEVRRGAVTIVRSNNHKDGRTGVQMMIAAIERRYDPDAYRARQAHREQAKAEPRQSSTGVL